MLEANGSAQGGEREIITKHDPELASLRNMRDLEDYVPHSGDLHGSYGEGSRGKSRGTRLSSGVTNRLKTRLKRQAQTAKVCGRVVNIPRQEGVARVR